MTTLTTPLFPLTYNTAKAHSRSSGTFSASRILGYTPSMMRTAYKTDASLTGRGVKIAIVCAFDNVAIQQSFDVFCREFSLPYTRLSVYYHLQRADSASDTWLTESSLDTQWTHTFAPMADIDVVFSQNAELDGMLSAAEYACDNLSPDIVLMCFGTPEGANLTAEGDFFSSKNCIFIASSGDEGGVVFYPSSSPNVISVGGTNLRLSPNTYSRISETAWPESGAGPSAVFDISDAQRNFVDINALSLGKRATPDLSLNAGENPGCACYVAPLGGWTTVSGTSLSAACFAGICACIKQRRPDIVTTGNLAEFLYRKAGEISYSSPQYNYHDVIFGKSGEFSAGVGWDFATGLGSPVIKQLLL